MGGAIFNYQGTLDLINSTLTGNSADGGKGGGNASGGSGLGAAVFDYNGTVTLLNSTIAGNTVTAGAAGTGSGTGTGAAGAADGAELFVIGDGYGKTSTVTTDNTIFADASTGKDVVVTTNNSGNTPTVTGGNNLVESNTGLPMSVIGSTADPKLGTLTSNGGPTQTLALQSGSPAIDAGSDTAATSLTTDQRGQPRVSGAHVDVGAFEVQPTTPSGPGTGPTPQTPGPLFLDLNGDGKQEPGEPTLPGRIVYRDLNGNGKFDPGEPTAVTGPDGSFTLSGTGTIRQFLFPGDVDQGLTDPTRLNSTVAEIPVIKDLFQQAASPREALVRALYRAVLGREADAAGLSAFLARMDAGMTQLQVSAAMWDSAEHRLDQIDGYYRDYLGRSPTQTERLLFLADFLNGATEEQIVVGFLSSDEYRALHPSDTDFVDSLYVELLGRFRNAGEATQYEGQVQSLGRAAFVRAFLDQIETRLRAIDGFYVGFENREGEQAGRQNWVDDLANQSLTYGGVAIQFGGLMEFVNKAGSA
jgi:hypothetical protein